MTSRSPDRNTFQAKAAVKKVAEDPTNEAAKEMLAWYEQLKQDIAMAEEDPEWQKDNMEYDLRNTDWILEKVRGDSVYAQHLYAAMCNNEFTKNAVWPILQSKRWSCSWRHSGGIIADMQQKGDYIDWYCSGIRGQNLDDEQFANMSKNDQERWLHVRAYVGESVVTDEIKADLFKLGWLVVPYEDEE